MSTVPTAPPTPRFSRTSVALVIGAGVVIALVIVVGLWLRSVADRTPASSIAPEAVNSIALPSPSPVSPLKYTEKDVEQLRRLDRLQWEHERQLEQHK